MCFKQSALIIYVIWSGFCAGNKLLHMDGQTSATMVEKGKRQLESLKEKTLIPQYGDCWLKSLDFLQDGCRLLSETVHVDIALHFTSCFMEMSGQEEPLECAFERTEGLKKLCMSQLSDRAFAVYTEFFTQTQNMCFFLQNQNWHTETEHTINRLSSYSRAAGEQLELVNSMQDALLQEQHKQFELQIQLMRLGRNLSDSLNGSQMTIEKLTTELKRSTEQHSLVLEELFREFHQLHRWVVGRYAFVDGLIFYLCYLFFLLLLTSFKRTVDVRGLLLGVFFSTMSLEWCLHKQQTISSTIVLDNYRWNIRQMSLICSFVTLVYYVYRFEDFSRHILTEIREQNRQILEHFVQTKMHRIHQNGSAKTNSNYVGTQFECRGIQASYFNRKTDLPPAVEQNSSTDDFENGNVINERRPVSRLSIVCAEEMREPSRSAASVESLSSRYNLRRK